MRYREALPPTIHRSKNWLEDLADEYTDDKSKVEPDNIADLCAVKVEIRDNETRNLLEAPSVEEFCHAQRNDSECSSILYWIKFKQLPKDDDFNKAFAVLANCG